MLGSEALFNNALMVFTARSTSPFALSVQRAASDTRYKNLIKIKMVMQDL